MAQAEYGLAEIWITVITDVRSAYDNYITYLKQVKLFQKIYDLTKPVTLWKRNTKPVMRNSRV